MLIHGVDKVDSLVLFVGNAVVKLWRVKVIYGFW